MTLTELQLTEPVVTALVSLLETNLPGVIDDLNATLSDPYSVQHPAQYLPFVPVPSILQGGIPAIGVQRLGSIFQDDTVFSLNAQHQYAVVAIISNPDQQALAWQLDRTLQAIAYTIQQDRKQLPAAGIMQSAGVWNVELERTEPGPLLGDIDPTNPAAPPRTFMSWVALVLSSKRTEV